MLLPGLRVPNLIDKNIDTQERNIRSSMIMQEATIRCHLLEWQIKAFEK